MQKYIQWLLLFLIILSPVEGSSADSFTKNILRDVSSELSEKGLTVRFEFSKPVLNPGEPVFGDTSVQIDIPQSSVEPAKRFFYTGDSRIPQIVAFPLNPNTLRVQFVLGEKLPGLEENFRVEDHRGALVVHLFNKEEDVLSGFLARASARIDSLEGQEEADDDTVSGVESISANIQTPLTLDKIPPFKMKQVAKELLPAETLSGSPLAINERSGLGLKKPLDPLATTVRTFAMFALVLALMFLIFYLFKKYVLKNTIFGGNEKFVRVLGSGFLGPKKSIVMVEVAGEVLVLGISNDNISLLMQIQDKDKIEEIKRTRKETKVRSFWDSGKGKSAGDSGNVGKTRLDGDFKDYLKQFSGVPTEKEKSVGEVTELIRKSHGKLKTT